MPPRKRRPLPAVGTKFSRHYQGALHHLEIVKVRDEIGYMVNGETYSSPSAAASSVTGNGVNGWAFWGIDADASSKGRRRI